jgi:hypothetical protein
MYNMSDLRTIIANPNGPAFQAKYLPLGRSQGKKQLHADCRQLGIRVTLKALQVIEKGYSHRCQITWANDITRCDYDIGRMGDMTQKCTAKRVGKGKKDGELDNFGRTIDRKTTSDVPTETEEEKKARLLKEKAERKAERIQKKKQKAWEEEKNKMANLDSWDDDM